MNSTMILRKIPLYDLLELLNGLYEEGANFVDITGKCYKNRDDIFFSVRDEYYNGWNDAPEKELTDEDINQLI